MSTAVVEPAGAIDNQAHKPWIEKYRPRTLDDVQSQREAVAALRACLSAGANMPHMLFYGPPGTGKTSSILAVARDLFGPDYLPTRVLELNASDDRGIAVVREKVKTFAHGAVSHVPPKAQSDGRIYPVPPFKLIILDEADALLPDAQAALRRMMEDFSEVTRFCILCNYVSRIIDPVVSRCAKFRFRPLTQEALYGRLRTIAEHEGIRLSDQTLKSLDRVAGGDLRLAIVYLQTAARVAPTPGDLTQEDFVAISGDIPIAPLEQYLSALMSGSFDTMAAATMEMVRQGYAASRLVKRVLEFLVSERCTLRTVARSALCIRVAEIEQRLLEKGDDMIQLLDLGSSFVTVLQRENSTPTELALR